MTYLQEIVICPTIFEKISRFFSEESEEDIDLAAYNKNLRLKRFVKDMNAKGYSFIEEMIKEIYNKTSSIGKKKMDVILKSILISDRIVVKNIENIENFTKDKTRNHIFNLAKLSESKIVNSEDEILKLENKIIDVLNDIEVLDFDEFIDPPSESRIFALKRNIRFKRGEKFEFEDILDNYLRDTTTLKISDRFIRRRIESYVNLIRILKCCDKLSKLNIYTNTREEEPQTFILTIEELSNQVMNHVGIEPCIKPTGRHRRTIETDKFRIAIDPGLDFVNENYIAERHDVEINITPVIV